MPTNQGHLQSYFQLIRVFSSTIIIEELEIGRLNQNSIASHNNDLINICTDLKTLYLVGKGNFFLLMTTIATLTTKQWYLKKVSEI